MRTAVLLINYGGPTKAEECRPYLKNIFMDPDLIPMPGLIRPLVAALASRRRASKLQENYQAMGRFSPILEETAAQAQALEEALGEGFRCFVGMRYWKPSIADACAGIFREGMQRIVLLPLYPHESQTTTLSSISEARRCLRKLGFAGEVREVRSFWDEPGYLGAFTERLASALALAPEESRVLFSAHGLPLAVARKDAYPGQVAATVQEVSRRLGITLHPISVPGTIPEIHFSPSVPSPQSSVLKAALAWQSRVGPMKWLEPSVETVLKEWARERVRDVVLVPVAFVNEHSETLYELDVLYAGMAKELGMAVLRVPTLGVAPAFIAGLARRVLAICK